MSQNKSTLYRLYHVCVYSICMAILLGSVLCMGCGEKKYEQEPDVAYQIYYINKEETKLVPQKFDSVFGTTEREIEKVMEKLCDQPDDVTLKSPINSNVKIKNCNYSNFMLIIDFDASYYSMEPITEVLTRAAIVRTMTQIEDVNYVAFHVEGQALTDDSGNLVGTMTENSFVDNAGAEINSYETVNLVLFYANEQGDGLVKTTKTVDYNTNISLEKLVVEQLVSGPNLSEAYPVINADTKVVSVTTRDGICYVNFDQVFLDQAYHVNPEVVIYAITNSLVELPKVNKVQIMVNGETDMIFRDSMPLKDFFERNLDLVE